MNKNSSIAVNNLHNLLHYSTLNIKPIVKVNEMENDMYRFIEQHAISSYDDKKNSKDEIDIANYLKDKLDEKYKDRDLCWHVIVGKNFGGYTSFVEKMYCYFYIGQTGFLIFATPDV